jgi:dienelactone hydrolase
MINEVTSHNEVPVFFDANGNNLFGIFTRSEKKTRTAIIVIPGGKHPLTTDTNRFTVRLCRRMAYEGLHAFRFDYHGAGESAGVLESISLHRPFVHDLGGAVRWLQDQGLDEFVVVGSCFGARTALAQAPSIPNLRGLVLISVPLREWALGNRSIEKAVVDWKAGAVIRRAASLDTLRGMIDRNRRLVYREFVRAKGRELSSRLRGTATSKAPGFEEDASQKFLVPFNTLVEREVPVLFVFGTGETNYYEAFERAKQGALGTTLDRAGPRVEATVFQGRVHGHMEVALQQPTIDLVSDWCSRLGMLNEGGKVSAS